MRNRIIGFVAAGLVGMALASPGWADESLWTQWAQASPKQRLAVRQLLRERYPELPQQLYGELSQHYRQLELKALRAFVGFRQAHPGLGPAVARKLLEDLEDEPAQAALDVAQAVLARYPNLPGRMQELRRTEGIRGKIQAMIAGRFPTFRTALLEGLATAPGGGGPPWGPVLQHVREKHRGLGIKVLLEASRLMDEKYPGLALELAGAHDSGQRPLPWLAAHHPDFVLEAARRIHAAYGPELRTALLEGLGELEQLKPPPVFAQTILALVEKAYPQLPAQVVKTRMEAMRTLHERVDSEFPELPAIIANTLQEKHPQLLARASASLDKHFPTLRQEVVAAADQALPGIQAEVKGFLGSRYPELKGQVEALLK